MADHKYRLSNYKFFIKLLMSKNKINQPLEQDNGLMSLEII